LAIEIPYTAAEIRGELEGTIGTWLRERGGTAALGGVRAGLRIVVGLVIMIISVYFFLADGPGMIVTIMQLSPLDDRYELELLSKFSNISRAVVVATLLSAFVQGVLAGVGYYVAGIKIVFALTGLTMLLAVVPFLGAASVWAPTAAWLLLGEERPVAAIVLALYGLCVVSTIDNFIKPYVLHGQSNLHPLLALMSVLGGVAAMGPIGILVGPMAVAFLQALLGMLRREIDELGEEGTVVSASPESSAAKLETQKAISNANKAGRPADSTPEPEKDTQGGKPDSAQKKGRPQPKQSRRSVRRRKRS
jgi:predicted PurR-regulated permease PerM